MAQTWDYDLQKSSYDGKATPLIPSIPYLLPESVHCYMHFRYDCGTTQSWTGEKHVECNVEFDITAFQTDSYPLLSIFLGDENQAGFTFTKGGATYNNITGTFNGNPVSDLSVLSDEFASWWNVDGVFTIYDTNIPIFFRSPNQPDVMSYDTFFNTYKPYGNPIPKAQMETVVNYGESEPPVSPEGREFRIETQWTTGTWTNDKQPSVVGQPYVQGVRGKLISGDFTFYTISGIDDEKLKYGILFKDAEFYDLEYTTDGRTWNETDTFPFDFIYRRRVNELGTFSYALSEWVSDTPIWENENDAQDYLDGLKNITESKNWKNISSQYPPQNYTGIDDSITNMGEVYTRSFFSQQYICSASALQEISNAFFDTDSGGITGIVDDIIKGLRMYGEDISNAIQGLMFFPIDLTQVFTSVQPQNYIYFGGYQFQMQNNVSKIIYPNGYIDFGSFVLKPSFNSYRDHAPYTRLYCFLAYIGWIELDVDRYLGKTVSIRYYIDTRTGGCLACIFANSILTDYATGQMGIQMPITVTSYTEYANAQLQTLLTFGNGQGQNASNIASMGGQLAQSGVSGGAIATASVGLGAVGLGIGATKTLYGLTQNNINNFNKTKGGSTGMLNMFLPQECLFLFEIQDSDETPNERSLQGYPSNASGQLQSFSGYLEVDSINLVCGGATDNEKAEIIAQLKSGVII